jgi:malate dehydrogenase (oxaloacetate-decarboxylating)
LLPPLAEARTISLQVAITVAKQAASEGLARPLANDDLAAAVKSMMWEPLYAPYRRPLSLSHNV